MDSEKTKEKTQEYTLKTGSHTWIDGKTYFANDPDNNKMQLTREQMERIGKDRFVGQSVEAAAAADIEALKEENRQLREQLAQMRGFKESENDDDSGPDPDSYADFVNRSVADITTSLQSITDPEVLDAILAEESKAGQPRVGVTKAIEARKQSLS